MKGIVSPPRMVPILLAALLVMAAIAAGARSRAPARAALPDPGHAIVAARVATPHVEAVAKPAPVATAVAALPAKKHAPAEAGMRAFIDPETGRIGMMPAIVPDDGSMILNDSDEGLSVQVMPNGSKLVDLQGRFQEYAVVQIGRDGKPLFRCVHDPKLIEREAPAPTPLPEER